MSLETRLTRALGIQHPVMLAGMDTTAGSDLVAAVANAGGFGCLGGVKYTPNVLREMIAETKAKFTNPNTPFGVDLLLPQVGGSARKTNEDYTRGNLSALLDVIIEGGAKLFVSAVGVPPKWAVEKLHKHGVLYMNVVGHPKHVIKACEVGADLICAQGGEAGGHTGDIPFSILLPACKEICDRYTSPLLDDKVILVGAGGVYGGGSLAAALMLGASGVWVGTRFAAAKESSATKQAKSDIINGGFDSVVKSIVWSGRPLRAGRNPYINNWEANRQGEIKDLTSKGRVPIPWELEKLHEEGKLTEEIEDQAVLRPMGIVTGLIHKAEQPAADIVREIVEEACAVISQGNNCLRPAAKL
ncbi:2-nitropropane dioxygenase [Tothia fuscella]|uniref:2-nitropropane dioxygenase n=1 Tax=Tothia fuscella TaxID=1048955 RepID=A0A9P4NP04_9PEZI|nr:2-nitropropane dioxygenase [Tothia fuscella]